MKAKVLNLFCIIISLLVLVATGCSVSIQAADLMAGIKPNTVVSGPVSDESAVAAKDFAARLIRACYSKEKNTLVSPVSVMSALAMTANAARGDTLDEMEQTLGMSRDELNDFCHAYMQQLPSGDKFKVSLANSIWFREDDKVTYSRDFFQTNADYFGAGIYEAPFDDSTLRDINNWVSDKTDGMIRDILDSIPDAGRMYLVNALAFDAKWATEYEKDDIKPGHFTTEDGTKRDVTYLNSNEDAYLHDDKAVGFKKYYWDYHYSFVALLPNEGITVEEYISALDGQKIHDLLTGVETASVSVSIPKFEAEYDICLNAALKSMGMKTAFIDGVADFSGIYENSADSPYINRVLHKTYISLDEKGTKAGAATVVGLKYAAAPVSISSYTVRLDRPFVYMLVDNATNTPLFIGTMMDIN